METYWLTTREAEKSHSLPYASWRPRKAGGIILVQIQRPLRMRGADGVHPSPRAREDRCSSSTSQAEQTLPSSTFYSVRISTDWLILPPHWGGKSIESTDSHVSLTGNTICIPRNNV